MNYNLNIIKKEVYDKCGLNISDFKIETESKVYDACRFNLNGLNIISRNAKITPKKVGQFVTFWKRNRNGLIEPLDTTDRINFFTVSVRVENQLGQFVFPKYILIEKEIISSEEKEGKRGFRVYAPWDKTKNKQAEKTQKWQMNYFYEIGASTDFKKVIDLFNEK